MRIVSGGIQHETNTFASVPTTLSDFQRDSDCGDDLLGGDRLRELYAGTGTIHGGYLDETAVRGIELVPVLSVHAQPAGRVEQASFSWMLDLLLSRIESAAPFDGVALDLHGAMVTDLHEDAEGEIVSAVRDLVGPDMPLVVTLDLHANITSRLASVPDCLIGFDTYPHVDMNERGREAIVLLESMIRGQVQPEQAFRQLPLMTMPPMQCTLREPMRDLIERLHEMESRPGVLTATIAMGFPFADIRDAGVTVLVTTDGDRELAEAGSVSAGAAGSGSPLPLASGDSTPSFTPFGRPLSSSSRFGPGASTRTSFGRAQAPIRRPSSLTPSRPARRVGAMWCSLTPPDVCIHAPTCWASSRRFAASRGARSTGRRTRPCSCLMPPLVRTGWLRRGRFLRRRVSRGWC